MATKRAKGAVVSKGKTAVRWPASQPAVTRRGAAAAKPAPKAAAKAGPGPAKPAARPGARPGPAPKPIAAPAARELALVELAERLRDAIQASKLHAVDPWSYTAKARRWAERAQALVEQVALSGDTAAARQAYQTLSRDVTRDADYREAHRLA